MCARFFIPLGLGLLLLLNGLAVNAHAQSATAGLSGTVLDQRGAFVSGATVTIADAAKAFERQAVTNGAGAFTLTQLPPSSYTVTIERAGFATERLSEVVLNVNDQSTLRVQLQIAQVGETVTVNDSVSLGGESPAVSTVVDRQFVENQPLNGRSFQTLVELSPGVVLTSSTLPTPGQFSLNGQRASSNYFTVDGVSANFGSTASVTLYETAGGAVPSYSALGTTSSLASVDAVQEFSIQTSTYAPEFGRQPGGQISLVTRSGTNELHGSLFDYGRNVLRGFPVYQLDMSLHRNFGLTERLNVQFRADAFNLFNHPNFANQVGILPDANFGRSTQLLGTNLGGLSSLYQIGGPRSFQLALKLQF